VHQHGSEANIFPTSNPLVTKKSSSLKAGLMQRNSGLQKRAFGDELSKQMVSSTNNSMLGPQLQASHTNHFIVHPIGAPQAPGSEAGRSISGPASSA